MALSKELSEFDWLAKRGNRPPFVREILCKMNMMHAKGNLVESDAERRLRFLTQLNKSCIACTMCKLGTQDATKGHEVRDPHVFSNMSTSSRIMVVGNNANWEEVITKQPICTVFDDEVQKHGFSRSDFYLTNMVKCWSKTKPNDDEVSSCLQFLSMELSIMKPKLVVALGQDVYDRLCGAGNYSEKIGLIVNSDKFDVKVYPTYDLSDTSHRHEISKHLSVICSLLRKIIHS
jgi:uracil-DNA glycosylase family 4